MNPGTRFKIMRRWLLFSAMVVPLAIAVTLIAVVGGHWIMACGSAILATILYLTFPFGSVADPNPVSFWLVFPSWVSRVATVFFVLWLVQFPEFSSFVDRVGTGGPLWDWRLLLAAALWTARIIWLNARSVAGFSDEQIYRFYSGRSS